MELAVPLRASKQHSRPYVSQDVYVVFNGTVQKTRNNDDVFVDFPSLWEEIFRLPNSPIAVPKQFPF